MFVTNVASFQSFVVVQASALSNMVKTFPLFNN